MLQQRYHLAGSDSIIDFIEHTQEGIANAVAITIEDVQEIIEKETQRENTTQMEK